MAEVSSRPLLERAARELHEARRRLEAAEAGAREPVSVLGVGLRLPGGISTPDDLWLALSEGAVLVGPLLDSSDGDRSADAPRVEGRWAALLERIDEFDARFFGISPTEAKQIDPQQRLLLEVAVEAVEDAGLSLSTLRERSTGVYVGIYGNDYALLQTESSEINAFTAPGVAHSIAANRISYQLDLRGPSIAIDTACSSSLAAIHYACQGLWSGDCDIALVGGVNVALAPLSTAVIGQALPLAPDGKCRPFDGQAEGIVRGEGCGVVVLARESDPLPGDRRPRSAILGSAINQDGRTNGMTAPNPSAQRSVMERALSNACVAAEDVVYVETHGTGTALGDPIEVDSIRRVYGAGARDCALGSLKANLGHLEAAAGILGLVKAMLVLDRGAVPPQVHVDRLNPKIELAGTRLCIHRNPTPLPDASEAWLAAVSSFGFGGTNMHVVLRAGKEDRDAPGGDAGGKPAALLLPVSARSGPALTELAEELEALLEATDASRAADLCAAAARGGSHHPCRICAVGEDTGGLLRDLKQKSRRFSGRAPAASQVVWVFSGQGAQWPGMGIAAMEAETVFRREIEACDREVKALAGWSVIDELRAPPSSSRLGETEIAQLSIASVQFAIVALLRAWGIEPDGVIGHSMGEVVAGCVAGAFERRHAFELLLDRARIIERYARGGLMASIALPEDQLERMLAEAGPGVGVAARNGPSSTVVAGHPDPVNELVARASDLGVSTRLLDVDYAFHSPLLSEARGEMEEAAADLPAVAPVIPFYSTVTGRELGSASLDARHWGRNLCEKVRFWGALRESWGLSPLACLEIGPHPVLASQIALHAEQADDGTIVSGTLRKDVEPSLSLAHSLAALYEGGHDLEWRELVRQRAGVSLPLYPWQRESFWIGRWRAGRDFDRSEERARGSRAVDAATADERLELLDRTVREALTEALSLEGVELDSDTPLEVLEIDSLVVVELRGKIEAELQIDVPLQQMLDAGTPGEIAILLEKLISNSEAGP